MRREETGSAEEEGDRTVMRKKQEVLKKDRQCRERRNRKCQGKKRQKVLKKKETGQC